MYKVHIKRALIFSILGLFAGLLIALVTPKLYEARIEIILPQTSQTRVSAIQYTDDIQQILDPIDRTSMKTEAGVLKSEQVFRTAVGAAALEMNRPDLLTLDELQKLYFQYDVVLPTGLAQGSQDSDIYDQTRFVTVKVRADNPQLAAKIADEAFAAYNKQKDDSTSKAITRAVTAIDNQVDSTKFLLYQTERDYQRYKAKVGVADMLARNQQLAQTGAGLTQQREAALSQLAAVRAEIAKQREMLKTAKPTSEYAKTTEVDPQLHQLQLQLADYQRQKYDLSRTYMDDSPDVRKIKESIRSTQAEIARLKTQSMQTAQVSIQQDPVYIDLVRNIAANSSKEQNLAATVASYDQSLKRSQDESNLLPTAEVHIAKLIRDRDTLDNRYKQLLLAQETLHSREKVGGNKADRLAPAEPDPRPVAPNIAKYVILATIAGLGLGLLYSFTLESLRQPVHTSWQLAELTNLPLAATVPTLPVAAVQRHLKGLNRPEFAPLESYRFMAFSLLSKTTRPKTILFTGIKGGVGTTTSAVEFAVSLAKAGTRVILVDTNIRRPAATRMFGLEGKTGLSDILAKTVLATDSDLLLPTNHENLYVMPAGSGTAAVSDAQTEQIKSVFEDLARRADVVVVDCAPCDVVSDAARIAQFMDQVDLVVSARSTSFRSIPVAQDILTSSGGQNISLVLTHASPTEEPFAARSAQDVAIR